MTCQKGKLFFAVGLPRSGKSSWCRTWSYEPVCHSSLHFYSWQKPRVVVSGDDFRRAIHGHAYIKEAEGLVFASMDIAAKALLFSGFDVIIDETSTTESSILRYLRIDMDAEPVFIDTPEAVCIERALATGKEYLVGPIQRMSRQLAELKKDWPATFERLKQSLRDRKDNDVVAL